MSNMINDNDFNISAKKKHEEATCFAKKTKTAWIVLGVVVAALSALDLMLFYEPITAVMYDTSEVWNAVLCVVCALLPIMLSAVAAHLLRYAKYPEEGKGTVYMAFALLAIAVTVVLLAVGWHVREGYWGDDSGVGLLLNVVAVAAALVAFIVDYVYARKLLLWKAQRNEAELERDALSHMDYLAQFTGMNEIDESRRRADNESYRRECAGVVIAGYEIAGMARKELARRVAKTPEDREHIINTPLQVGPEQITGQSNAETFERAYASVGAPSAQEIECDWPLPANSHYLCEEQRESLEEHARRLREIQGAKDAMRSGTAGCFDGAGADEVQEPISARFEAACS